MRKAQTEIFGLVVIVLLLSVAMLFVINFLVKSEPPAFKKEFQQEEIGMNWINAFLKTTAMECAGNDMTDLIVDCAENPTPLISCDIPPITYTSCDYLSEKTEWLLRQSLQKWDYNNYKMTFEKKPGGKFLSIQSGDCSGEKRVSTYVIPISGGQVNIRLEICSGRGIPSIQPCNFDSDCNDNVDCTVDSCDEATDSCTHTPQNSQCDDEDPCNGVEYCNLQGCQLGTTLNCDDGITCTDDSCNPASGCDNTINSNNCLISNICYTNRQKNPNNECQICDTPVSQISWTNGAGTCDDGMGCTENDQCTGGTCGGAPRNCDDNVDCTEDSCDEATDSCTFTPDNTRCPPDTPCTNYNCDPTSPPGSGCLAETLISEGGTCTTAGGIPGTCSSGECIIKKYISPDGDISRGWYVSDFDSCLPDSHYPCINHKHPAVAMSTKYIVLVGSSIFPREDIFSMENIPNINSVQKIEVIIHAWCYKISGTGDAQIKANILINNNLKNEQLLCENSASASFFSKEWTPGAETWGQPELDSLQVKVIGDITGSISANLRIGGLWALITYS